MNKTNSVIVFLVIFILAAIILRMWGIFDFSSIELLAAIFMLSGIAAVYSSFSTGMKGILFIGTVVFFVGILIFINSRFDLESTRQLLFPAVLLICGSGFLLLYIDDSRDKLFLVLGGIFFLSGVAFILFFRTAGLNGFFISFWNLAKSYWFILVLAAGLILVLRKY